MKLKKILSLALSVCMVASTVVTVAPETASASPTETNLISGYETPWGEVQNDGSSMTSKVSSNVEDQKFTHQEWTGTTYTDLNGEEVKGADVYGINREESSMFASTSVIYDNVEHAIDGAVNYNKDASKYVQFLTGENAKDWSLVVLQNQEEAQGSDYEEFYKSTYSVDPAKKWKSDLELPCSWTRQGFDFSIYTNSQMPWQSEYDTDIKCPTAPTVYNPVGLYRKNFDVDPGLSDANGRVYISFQGVESAYYVYVNGKEVGYSEDSYSPHSFDITDYLTEDGKDNLLAVKVHKFCDGTWMEDQDFYYDGGIFRDVYLYSAPLVHIQDYTVVTDLDENYVNADLSVSVDVTNASTEAADDYSVDVRLYDENGEMFVNGMTIDLDSIQAADGDTDGKTTGSETKTVIAPKLWSAETPNLYTLVLSLYNSKTKEYMGSVSQQIGFREIEFVRSEVDENGNRTTKDEEYEPIRINGKQILLKGTNRHDTDPVYGKYVPKETYEKDVELMKQFNLNAIRTSHYSNDEYLYYLCDKYGLYMMAETNLECHALQSDSGGQWQWEYVEADDKWDWVWHTNESLKALFKKLAMDRTITTFERLKNRSAVVMWSTGNECYYSSNAAYADHMFSDLVWYFKDNDLTRPVHSESSNTANGTDMGSNMYASVGTTQGKAKTNMPYVLCEYAHAMGNAIGNFTEYWDAIRSSDNMLGGFIWDWVDQSRMLSLDSLPKNYNLTEDSKGIEGEGAITNLREVSDPKALVGMSADGYALFDDSSYNEALSGSGKAFTLEVICKPTTQRGDQVLMAKGDYQFALKTNSSGQLEFFAYYDGSWNSVTVNLPDDWLNNWHQIAATYDQGEIKLYSDGELLVSGTGNTTVASSTVKLGVGYCADNGRYFDGEISLGRVYTRALTQEELVAQNTSNPAIKADSDDVLLWADFSKTTVSDRQSYDYYSEEFAHKTLYKEEAKGSYYGYGGDSGESPHDGSFCVNGLVSPDRDPQPELWEVKYQYQNVWFTATEKDLLEEKISVYNENNFLNLNDFDVTWSLLEDGEVIDSGTIDESIAGRETKTITVPYLAAMPAEKKAGAEYYLNLSVQLKEDTLWAKAGHEVAYEQFEIPVTAVKVDAAIDKNVTVDESDETLLKVSGENFSFELERATGTIKNYVYKDETLLTTGPVPRYVRAYNDNNGWLYNDANWWRVNADGDVTASDIQIGTNEYGQKVITVELASAAYGALKQKMIYTIDGSGTVTLNASVDATATTLGYYKRIGTVMKLPAGYENIEWYGNGPVESFWDRQDFARVGTYQSTVSDMFYPFLYAQDTGNITGTKWFTVTDPKKNYALAITAEDTVEFSALHFTAEDLEQAVHPYELHPVEDTILTVNYRSAGTGCEGWGAGFLPQYLLPNNQEYTYKYTILPYAVGDDVMDITRPYRTTDSLAAFIEELDSITADYISSDDLERFEELTVTYNALSDDEKAQVTEQRYAKLQEAIALIEQLGTVEKVEDKSANKFNLVVGDTVQVAQREESTVFEGYNKIEGTNANETFNNLVDGDHSFTVEAVLNPNNYGYGGGDYNNTIISKGDGCVAFRISEQSAYFFIKNTNGNWLTAKRGLTAEQMNSKIHVAGIYDAEAGTISVYLEGEELITTECGKLAASEYPMGVGYCPETNRTTNASFYNLHIYSKALTKAELDAGEMKADDTNVVTWFDFDEMLPIAQVSDLRTYTSSLELEAGDIKQLKVEKVPFYAAGTIAYASGNSDVAEVDENGMVTAKADGATEITATCEGKSIVIPVKVGDYEIPITGITVKTESVTLKVDETHTIEATVAPADTTDDMELTYTSSKPEVAEVSSTGMVTAKAEGTADITVASKARPTVTATVKITVTPASVPSTEKPITGITVKAESVTLKVDETHTIEATVAPADTTDDKELTYTSSKPEIAEVSSTGVVTAKAEGTADIAVASKARPTVMVSVKITVTPASVPSTEKPITGITVKAESATLKVNETHKIEAAVTPADTTDDKALTYTSSKPEIAEVSSTGVVTAKAEGTADITVASKARPSITKTVHITVEKESDVSVPVDNKALSDAVEAAKKIDLTGYSAEAVNAFKKVLSDAEAVLADPKATQEQVDAALSELKKAVDTITSQPVDEVTLPAVGTTFDVGSLQYKVTKSDAVNGTVTVSKLLKQSKKVTIPATVTNKDGITFKVTAINKKVFQKNNKLQTLIVGANVANIGTKSFFNCKKLKSITFKGTKVPKLGKKAFKGIKKNCKIAVTKKISKKKFNKFKKALINMAGKNISVKQKK